MKSHPRNHSNSYGYDNKAKPGATKIKKLEKKIRGSSRENLTGQSRIRVEYSAQLDVETSWRYPPSTSSIEETR